MDLANLYCVDQVIQYSSHGLAENTHNCSKTNCSSCEGDRCNWYTVTVTDERGKSDISMTAVDCKYGDTIVLRYPYYGFVFYELVITGEPGGTRYIDM